MLPKAPANPADEVRLSIALSPTGTLSLQPGGEEDTVSGDVAWRIQKNFHQNQGLFHLGARELHVKLPPVLAYWRDFSHHFMKAVSSLPALPPKGQKVQLPLDEEELSE